MKRILLTIAIMLTAFLAANSQTVDEAKTLVYFDRNDMVAKLSIDSPIDQSASIRLSLLNPNDTVKKESDRNVRLSKGSNLVEIRMPFGYMREVEDLIWKRLRYTIKTGQTEKTGIVSLSQIMPDLFELKAVSGEYVSAGTIYVVRVNSVHPVTRAPIPNVELAGLLTIELEEEEDKEFEIQAEGLTDVTGFATLMFTIPSDIKPERDYGDADVELRGVRNGVFGKTSENLSILTSDFDVMINTDKPLYQPGQTIFIRGLAVETLVGKSFGAPLPDTDLEFTITDGDNTKLYRETVKTSRFGIASIKWQIPDNAKLGSYSVKVEIGETETYRHSSFKVSRYELPNFFVNTKPDKDYYLPKDKKAKVKIDSVYLFGKPVAGGKVKVVRESERQWNFREQKWDIIEEAVYEGTTDKDGIYEASIDLKDAHKELAEDEHEKFKDVNFTAYFTDSTTNITEQRRFDLRISKEDIHIYFVGLEKSDFNDKLPLRFYVTTSLADGTPAEADVEIKGAFEDHGKRKTLARVKTNRYGASRVEIKLPKCPDGFCSGDDIEIEAVARDSKKRTGKALEDEISIDEDEKELRIKSAKTIFKAGEPVGVEIVSSEKSRRVLVDVVKGASVLSTHEIDLNNGSGKLLIPYRPDFENALMITAYFNDDGDTIDASTGIIYPKPVALDVKAETDGEIYRPATNVALKYGVGGPSGPAGETALGVYVLDRAVEERALTDSNFGGGFDPFADFRRALGHTRSFGGVSQKQLEELDLSKPVPADLELAAEIMLRNYINQQEFYDGNLINPRIEFKETIDRRLSLVSLAMKFRYSLDYVHATDHASFERIMKENGIDFASLRDPWGNPYRMRFSISRENSVVSIISNGPNKLADKDKDEIPDDDFVALETRYNYFTETGFRITRALDAFAEKTGTFVRDEKTLSLALKEGEIDIASLKDRWGAPYRYSFRTEGRQFLLDISSDGPEKSYTYDDFRIWTHSADYFSKNQALITKILEAHTIENKSFPKNEAEFKQVLEKGGVDFDELRDGWGRPFFVETKTEKVFGDRVTIETISNAAGRSEERYVITPVTREIASFTVRSYGEKGEKEEYEWRKPWIARFAGMVSEQERDDAKPNVIVPLTVLAGGQSAVYGVVKDASGAAIPGATVDAVYISTGAKISHTTDEYGAFLIGNLPAGSYRLEISASGFNKHILGGIELARENVVEVNAVLEVGSISAMVEVTADASVTIDSSSATMSTSITSNVIESLPSGVLVGGGRAMRISGGVLNSDQEYEITYYAMDGASGAENTFLVDGQEVTNFRTGQLNVVTRSGDSGFEAEYGGTAGGVEKKETPRVRSYFPETLLWAPEIVTDKDGNVTVQFKLADNITTWKIYAIASNLEGRIGISEKEIKTFQPFFVDLLPPRVLTKGDEISLPVQVRNYTEEKQNVDVTMRGEKWFEFFDPRVQPVSLQSSTRQVAEPDSVALNVAANTAGRTASNWHISGGGSPTTLELDGVGAPENFFNNLRKVEVNANSTENTVFDFRATNKIKDGLMNVTAVAKGESDAIEKPVTVNPDGKEIVESETRLFAGSAAFDVHFPANALAGTPEAELKIYPNLFAHVSEAVGGLLQRPYGCGEQTVSSTYPNLMILKFTKDDNKLRKTASAYLQKGYMRLLGFQVDSGGFSYWGGNDDADIALTAYALRFLNDASEFIDVDESVIQKAKVWLAAKQKSNGMWTTVYGSEDTENTRRTWMISTYVVRSLATNVSDEDSGIIKSALERGLLALARENQKLDEPYSLANLGLAYYAIGQTEKASEIAARLRQMAKREGDTVYWKLETNTPFFGWGTAGRIETTAVVLQLLQKVGPADDELISDGISNLLRLKDRYGVWYSTQATINVLDALLGSIENDAANDTQKHTAGVFVNGVKVQDIELPPANEPGYPLAVDITSYLDPVSNRIEIRTNAKQVLQAQVVGKHYIDWSDFDGGGRDMNQSRQLALDYECDRHQAAPTDEITCRVKTERVGFRGYGMLLAEIGIPPGADVDRASLDKAKKDDWSFSRYDVLPDRIVIYMWSKAGGTEFDFKFKPRYGINAQTPASFVYDYYNEEAKAFVKPMRFIVRER